MRRTLASIVAVAMAATLGSVTGSAQSGTPVASPAAAKAVATPQSATPFAALARVKAVPMAATELKAVKGQHLHFVTPSQNETFGPGSTGLHLVNRNNTDNWSDLYGDGPVGPGYHGLCRAALNSPNLFIPGQNPITGHGGGC